MQENLTKIKGDIKELSSLEMTLFSKKASHKIEKHIHNSAKTDILTK